MLSEYLPLEFQRSFCICIQMHFTEIRNQFPYLPFYKLHILFCAVENISFKAVQNFHLERDIPRIGYFFHAAYPLHLLYQWVRNSPWANRNKSHRQSDEYPISPLHQTFFIKSKGIGTDRRIDRCNIWVRLLNFQAEAEIHIFFYLLLRAILR